MPDDYEARMSVAYTIGYAFAYTYGDTHSELQSAGIMQSSLPIRKRQSAD